MPKKMFDKPKVNAQDQDIKIDMETDMQLTLTITASASTLARILGSLDGDDVTVSAPAAPSYVINFEGLPADAGQPSGLGFAPAKPAEPAAPVQTAPVAITEVLIEAAFALAKHEKLRKELRASEEHLRKLCRQYDQAAGTRGFAPHHLAQACKARGLMV